MWNISVRAIQVMFSSLCFSSPSAARSALVSFRSQGVAAYLFCILHSAAGGVRIVVRAAI